jgi:hypothetical protein
MVSFLDMILPDSLNDGGAILIWVLTALLLVIVWIDIVSYRSYRKSQKKIEKTPKTEETVEPAPISFIEPVEDKEKEFMEIHNKVDRLIEANKI